MRSRNGLRITAVCLTCSFKCPFGTLAEPNVEGVSNAIFNTSTPGGRLLMSACHGHAVAKELHRSLLRDAETPSAAFELSSWDASGAETYVDFGKSELGSRNNYVTHIAGGKEETNGRKSKPPRQSPSVVRRDQTVRSTSGRLGACSGLRSDGSSFLPASRRAPESAAATTPGVGASSASAAETWWNCTAYRAASVGPPQPMGANLLVIAAPGSDGGSLSAIFAKLATQRPPLCGRRYDGGTVSGSPGATPPVQVVKADTVKSCAPHSSNLLWGPLPLDFDAVARFTTPPAPTPDPKETQTPKSKKARPPLTSPSTAAHSARRAHSSHSERTARSSLPTNQARALRRRRARRRLQSEQQQRALVPGVQGVGSGTRSSMVPQAVGTTAVALDSPLERGQHSVLSGDGSASNSRKGTGHPKASLSSSSRVAGGGTQLPAVLLPSLPGAVYTMAMLREPFDRLVACARLAGVGRVEFERSWGLRMATNTQTSLVNGVGPLLRGALNENTFEGHPFSCATSPARAAAEACNRLLRTFTVVGVTDKYVESLWLAQRAFGWGEALILEQLSLPRWRSRARSDDIVDPSQSSGRSGDGGVSIGGGSTSGSTRGGSAFGTYFEGGESESDPLGGSLPIGLPLGASSVSSGAHQPSFTASQVSASVRARLRSRELCDVEVYEFASDLVTSRLLHAASNDVKRFASFTKRLKTATLRKAKHDAAHGPPL